MKPVTKRELHQLYPGCYIGIDPGESGAIACVKVHGSRAVVKIETGWFPTKGTEGYLKIDSLRRTMRDDTGPGAVYVERERVTPMMSPKAATTFMTGYGFCLGYLAAIGVSPWQFDPAVWMRVLKLPSFQGSTGDRAGRKRHYTEQIRALWDPELIQGVPGYAVDAYGILLAGLISMHKLPLK